MPGPADTRTTARSSAAIVWPAGTARRIARTGTRLFALEKRLPVASTHTTITTRPSAIRVRLRRAAPTGEGVVRTPLGDAGAGLCGPIVVVMAWLPSPCAGVDGLQFADSNPQRGRAFD